MHTIHKPLRTVFCLRSSHLFARVPRPSPVPGPIMHTTHSPSRKKTHTLDKLDSNKNDSSAHLFIFQHGISGLAKDGRLQLVVHDEGLLGRMWLDGAALPSSADSPRKLVSKSSSSTTRHDDEGKKRSKKKINNWRIS